MHAPSEFGTRLRQLRIARDLTQEALAEAVGCASQTLRSFEVGRRRPSREMAARLADILQLPAAERDTFLRLARVPLDAAHSRAKPPPNAAPALVSPAPPYSSIMSQPADALIGRHRDQERLRRALLQERQRLVTLLGPGGAGKTRLALHVAGGLAPNFAAGSAVAALAAVRDAAGVIATVATAVGCPLAGVADPQAALLAFLRERSLLLVLDNLEHLLGDENGDALTALLTAILAAAPGVALLVTSRERLNLQVEWVVELGGLSVPADDHPDSVARADAVLLFVARAQRITRTFALDEANQPAVAQICRRLDGLPLAIELAAAQIVVLPPAALLGRLDHALPLLEGGARDLPQRQRTMRATIQWSYDLLPEDERAVFERLGVLVGNWSLEAIEAVSAGGAIAQAQVFPLLRRLLDRSLVVRDDADGDTVRYRMLEPVRQFAREQLGARPAQALEAQQRHATHFLALAERLGSAFRSPQPEARFIALVARLEQEYPNVRAAIVGALARSEAETAALLGAALTTFWWYRGQLSEPRGWMQAALSHGHQLSLRVRARASLALLIACYGGPPDQSLLVGHEALALFEQADDSHGLSYTLMLIGLAHMQAGDVGHATQALERAHELAARANDPWLETATATTLGFALALVGDVAQSTALLDEALTTARAHHDTWNISNALFNRALVMALGGNVERVAQACRTWLAFMPEVVAVNGSAVSLVLEGVAAGAVLGDEPERAARLFGAADALRTLAGSVPVLPPDTPYARAVAALRQQLLAPNLAAAWAAGRTMPVAQAVDEALAITLGVHTDRGDTP